MAGAGAGVVGVGPLKLEPMEAKFLSSPAPSAAGYAFSYHKITNTGRDKLALKVKCSDNRIYRLRPVFCVLEGGKDLTLTVARTTGAPDKKDKLVIQAIKAEVTDAQSAWRGRSLPPEAQVTLVLSHGGNKAAPSPGSKP